jgi:hypothetical protein
MLIYLRQQKEKEKRIIRQMSTLNDRTIARLVIFGPWGSLCSGEKVRSNIIA